MTQVAFIDLAAELLSRGFPKSAAVPGVAIVCAESDRNPEATHTNVDGSVDRGIWQFNDRWHPEVTDEMAFDWRIATGEAYRVWQGAGFGPWSTWTNGSYKTHLEAARVAVDGALRVANLKSQIDAAAAAYAQIKQALDAATASAAALQARIDAALADLQPQP